MSFVEDSYDSAPVSYRAIAGYCLDFQALDGDSNVVLGDVVRRGLGDAVVEDMRRQPCRQQPREVGAVVGAGAKFAANHRYTTGSVCARHVVGKVEEKKLGGQRAAVRGCFCRGGTDC